MLLVVHEYPLRDIGQAAARETKVVDSDSVICRSIWNHTWQIETSLWRWTLHLHAPLHAMNIYLRIAETPSKVEHDWRELLRSRWPNLAASYTFFVEDFRQGDDILFREPPGRCRRFFCGLLLWRLLPLDEDGEVHQDASR